VEDVGTKILSDRHCHLGEGCTYDPVTDTAWWFDILERTLFRADLASGAVAAHTLPWMASVVAFIDDHRQLLATENGLYVRDIVDGRLTLHVALEADNPATRSNDGRVHPCGALWIGTMGRKAEKGAGAIYHFGGGELRRLYAGISIPNAICFSPDGASAYFTDTREAILYRVAIDPATALPTGNARWGGSCIDAYTPEGERVRTIRVPAKQPSCPVFVGANFDRLLVTTAWEGMDERAKAADPHHGQTFILDVGARGRPEPRVRLGAT
jgi:sugar lactone lactonase YvrE